jgi:deoxyadenosine/deoxycytidine kinase
MMPLAVVFRSARAAWQRPSTIVTRFMSSNQSSHLLITVEGNIGAGKSTLLHSLRKTHPLITFIDEPLGHWNTITNDDGKNLLETFYEDRPRWSYTFQTCSMLSRFESIENSIAKMQTSLQGAQGPQVFLTERCLDTDINIFTSMLRDEGSINQMEYSVYELYFNFLQRQATPISGILYVNTSPTVCAERIKQRGRSGEEGIPFEYLVELDKYHRKWMDSTDVPVLRIDNDDELPSTNQIDDFLREVMQKCD